MKDWCNECEVMQDFLPVGNCPACGAENLMMENATSTAICKRCGKVFGIPKARIRLCEDDLFNKNYTVTFCKLPQKESLLHIAKITDRNVVDIHRTMKAEIPQFTDLTFFQAYNLTQLFYDDSKAIICTPSLKNFGNFEICWHEHTNCCP